MYPDLIQRDHPDDQYLFEFDRDEKGRTQFDTDGVTVKFTDRAKAAQEAKWRRLSAIFGPRKTIPRSMAACNGGNPPRLAYGWAHTRDYFWEYAKFHNIELDVTGDEWMTRLAGTTLIKYGELTEEQKTNKELVSALKSLARLLVLGDLREKTGVELERVTPFTYEWKSLFALYNNYNVGERTDEMEEVGGVPYVIEIIQEAMTFGDHKPELLWWYDWAHLTANLSTPL
ncbi:hypothetical protein K466DRAFT_556795 [Polyporus arcularius HHB13444]|uniref:Uncharacterized protein n=1 Tax=Polyporus arcularius HHB13444 TaxID=1314778 RepID=A0A5C3NZS7_9APHY|nr:hypothetical protein K466DRAFT_556795 [Polyporus arcularius HHB13444]